jgi:hypothetical protein
MRIKISFDMLPEHMREGARLWLEHGKMTGRFLTAVMENDLMEAFRTADHINVENMRVWADWLYNEAPIGSYGSPEAVRLWREAGGLRGVGQ